MIVGIGILLVWLIVVVAIVGTVRTRSSRTRPLRDWVQSQPVTFSTRAVVRVRSSGGGWGKLKGPRGAQLVVRGRGIEVSLVGAGSGLIDVTTRVLSAEQRTMSIDRVGWAGTPLAATDCIVLSGHDPNGSLEIAVTPEAPLTDPWQALVLAGVRPADR